MFEGLTEDERRHAAMDLFVRAEAHTAEQNSRMIEDHDFKAGKQWSKDDSAKLKNEHRPVETMNIIHGKICRVVGVNEDNRRDPRITPVGQEDRFTAQALNAIVGRLYHDANVQDVEMAAFEDAATGGWGFAEVDVNRTHGDPTFLELQVNLLSPFDVFPDPDSEHPDYSDARYIFAAKWLSKGEFKSEYPDHAGRIDEIFGRLEDREMGTLVSRPIDDIDTEGTDPYSDVADAKFFNRREKKVRVIRMQYKQPVKKVYVQDPRTGETIIMSLGDFRTFQKRMRELGLDGAIPHDERWDEEIRWLDFIATDVLYEDTDPLNIGRFNIVPMIAYRDRVDGTVFGLVHLLKDAQRETNKRWSQMTHLLVQQSQPGMIVEEGALVDVDDAQIKSRTPGGIVIAKDGALAGNRIIERTVPQFPDAPARMHEMAVALMSLIVSDVSDTLVEPRGIPEAAATAQLRHRQGILALKRLFSNFQCFQKNLAEIIARIAVTLYSDRQLMTLLGNEQVYAIQNGVIVNPQTGEQAQIRDLRHTRWNVEFESVSGSGSQKMIETQMLMALAQVMPGSVDPEVMFEKAFDGEDTINRLKTYWQNIQQAQAQGQQKQEQAFLMEQQQEAQLKLVEMQRKAQHDERLEDQAALDSEREHERGLLELLLDEQSGQREQFLQALQTIATLVKPEPSRSAA